VIPDDTLGGYLAVHDRPPAFTGPDGAAYSVDLFVDAAPEEPGRFGGALVFVRWSADGEHPVGHVETDFLTVADSPDAAEARLKKLTLHDVKAHLDRAVSAGPPPSDW
jgi:hypothetical protein